MSQIAIRTPSRLHFSLIDLNGKVGRIDGSVGLAISQPEFLIVAQTANSVLINSSQYTDRAQKVVEKLKKKYNFSIIDIFHHKNIANNCLIVIEKNEKA